GHVGLVGDELVAARHLDEVVLSPLARHRVDGVPGVEPEGVTGDGAGEEEEAAAAGEHRGGQFRSRRRSTGNAWPEAGAKASRVTRTPKRSALPDVTKGRRTVAFRLSAAVLPVPSVAHAPKSMAPTRTARCVQSSVKGSLSPMGAGAPAWKSQSRNRAVQVERSVTRRAPTT